MLGFVQRSPAVHETCSYKEVYSYCAPNVWGTFLREKHGSNCGLLASSQPGCVVRAVGPSDGVVTAPHIKFVCRTNSMSYAAWSTVAPVIT